MHISTIGLLTILLPFIAVGAMQEAKSWADFQSIMKNGDTYCLMVDIPSQTDADLKFMADPCSKFPSVKCYYGIEGVPANRPPTSFDEQFKNKGAPAFFFFKNGQQKFLISHVTADITLQEIEEGFKTVQ